MVADEPNLNEVLGLKAVEGVELFSASLGESRAVSKRRLVLLAVSGSFGYCTASLGFARFSVAGAGGTSSSADRLRLAGAVAGGWAAFANTLATEGAAGVLGACAGGPGVGFGVEAAFNLGPVEELKASRSMIFAASVM